NYKNLKSGAKDLFETILIIWKRGYLGFIMMFCSSGIITLGTDIARPDLSLKKSFPTFLQTFGSATSKSSGLIWSEILSSGMKISIKTNDSFFKIFIGVCTRTSNRASALLMEEYKA